MNDQNKRSDTEREYPPIWEKVVPIALWILGAIVVILILIVLAVALGILPATG